MTRRYSLTDALILAAQLEHRKAKRGDRAAVRNFIGYCGLALSRRADGDRRWIIPPGKD